MTRENAPALPWVDSIEEIIIDGTDIGIVGSGDGEPCRAERRAMWEAVQAKLRGARYLAHISDDEDQRILRKHDGP